MKAFRFGGTEVVLGLLALVAAGTACDRGTTTTAGGQQAAPQSATGTAPRILAEPSRTLSIPVITYDPRTGAPPPPEEPGMLTIRLEAEDQQAEGPQSFAVLDDGSLVIADPLRERLAVYSSTGTFRRSIDLGAAVSHVAAAGGRLELTLASTGEQRAIELDGSPAARTTALTPPAPTADVALNPERSSGRVRWKGPAGAAAASKEAQAPELAVQLERPDEQLASLQVIAGAPNQRLYVLAESMARSSQSLSSVGALVRRYSAAGALEIEVRGIPVDYYVTPTTPFRVADGVLYQLFPKENKVFVHVWDLR